MAGEATLKITLGEGIQYSNYNNNSFVVGNIGTKGISKIEIDVTNALFPDTVFDPYGVAGDTVAKELSINFVGSTGVIAPSASSYIGAGGTAGFEGIRDPVRRDRERRVQPRRADALFGRHGPEFDRRLDQERG